jgi:hypothetical protein
MSMGTNQNVTIICVQVAQQINGAVNLRTLTGSNFKRILVIQFPDGSFLRTVSNSKVIDENSIDVDIKYEGTLPEIRVEDDTQPLRSEHYFAKFTNNSVISYGKQRFIVNERIIEGLTFAEWNYDKENPLQFPQTLDFEPLSASYCTDKKELKFDIVERFNLFC